MSQSIDKGLWYSFCLIDRNPQNFSQDQNGLEKFIAANRIDAWNWKKLGKHKIIKVFNPQGEKRKKKSLARTKLLELIFCTDILLPLRKVGWLIGRRKKELRQVTPNHGGLFLGNETYYPLANWIAQHYLDYLVPFHWSYFLQLVSLFHSPPCGIFRG